MALATGTGKEAQAAERVLENRSREGIPEAVSAQEELCQRLARIIDQRTAGRVHSLEVCRCDATGGVAVRGVVGSHYVRQLVLAAVLEALGQDGLRVVRLDVHVRRPTHS